MSFGTHPGAPMHPGTCGGGPGGSRGSAARARRVVWADRPDPGRLQVLGLTVGIPTLYTVYTVVSINFHALSLTI